MNSTQPMGEPYQSTTVTTRVPLHLISDEGSVSSPEVSASDMYEHEMVRSETKEMRTLHLGCASIAIILSILLTIPFLYYILSPRMGIMTLPFCLIFFCLNFLMLKGIIFYHSKINLTITDKEVLILSPRGGVMSGPGFREIKIPIHEITDVSAKNPRSPELKSIIHENKTLKVPNNQNLYWTYWIHRSRYQYVLSINEKPFSDSIQFVDIELQGGKKILVEFDDAENFVSVLKRRISQNC